ncbi:MAG: glycoside hydrolase family 78 protein [Tannerella sp.]|nr:glycoside hydrolase family 78 protein [Tannerella sp.]
MKMKKNNFIALILFLCFSVNLQAKMTPTALTCEMMTNPLAIETEHPRFGWKLLSDVQGDRQTAYQIIVSSSEKNEVWNSGKVKSGQSQFILFGGKKLQPATRYYWHVKVWDNQGKETETESEPVFFETAPAFSANTQWIGAVTRAESNLPVGRRNFHNPSLNKEENKALYENLHPLALRSILLRKSFNVSKPVEKAVVYASGLGHYNLFLNGEKVSRDLFTPAISDYDKTVYYNTYQLDTLLQEKENVIGVLLGNGFYNAVGNRYRKLWVSFGPPTLFFEMHLYYKDGTTEVIASDKSWKYDLSPITFNDIYGGEDYDARLEQTAWNKAGFNDKAWKPVVVQEAPQGKLQAQQLTNVRCLEQYGAVSMTKVDSSYILNMGQNLSGYPGIKVIGKKGQTIQLTVGELLDKETGKVSQKQSGSPHFYSYTLKGEEIEEWFPEFSYYGFQYIQIDGADVLSSVGTDKPLIVDVKSHFIYNSVPENGHFESSNELFNRAHILIKNAVKSNMQAVFTDCPHREKLGWLEETHLNGPGLLYNWNLTQFFPKVMEDIANGQRTNGLVPSIVPEYVVFGDDFTDSPEWGSAAVIVPWMYYRFYGDNSLIRKYYDVMKRYTDYLTSKSSGHIVSHGLGDWYDYGEHAAGYSKNSPIEVSATSHYYYSVYLLAEAAKMLGKSSDEKKYVTLAKDIRKAFNDKFFNKDTRQYGTGSQFCNAVAIFMGIVESQYKQAVMENLKADIRAHGNRLTTGDVGNRYLFQALALNGENELMYLMNNHEEAPGYGFQLKFGVTTLTEQWDPRKGNSWNHFMMGQIDEWFFRSLAGIEPSTPGFKEFTIQPHVAGDLTYVKADHETLYGTISVEWKRENNRFHLSVNIPVNTKATVILPNGTSQQSGSGKWEFECELKP